MNLGRARRGAALVALLTISALVAGCNESGSSSGDSSGDEKQGTAGKLFDGKKIGAGVKKGQPGLSQKPENGYKFKGFERDLLDTLKSKLGFRTRAFDITSRERGPLLKEEVLKLVVASYSIDRDEKNVLFTAPYMKTPQGVLVPANDHSITDKDSLKGKTLCTSKGSIADRPGTKERFTASVITKDDYKKCVEEMHKKGTNVDGVLSDTLILRGFEENAPSDQPVKVVKEFPGPSQLYGIGLPRGYERECRAISKELKSLVREGTTWSQMFEKAFPELSKKEDNFENHYKPDDEDFEGQDNSQTCKVPGKK